MDIKKYYRQAKAEYLCNVYEFISTGEGRKLTRLENMHVRIKYPEVVDWYNSLDTAGKQRVCRFLVNNYGAKKNMLRQPSMGLAPDHWA